MAAFDQLAVVGLLDIVGADPLEHVTEQVEAAIGFGGGRARRRADQRTRGCVTSNVAAAPAAALRRTRETLRIIREPFRLHLRPTMGLDRSECCPCETRYTGPADREQPPESRQPAKLPHRRNRLSRQHELADVDRNPLHPGKQHMIPATGIEDQELSVTSERP